MTHNRSAFFRSEAFQEWGYADTVAGAGADTGAGAGAGVEKVQFIAHVISLVTILVPLCLAMCVLLYKYSCVSSKPSARGSQSGFRFSDDDAAWLSELSERGEGGRGGGWPDAMQVSTHSQSQRQRQSQAEHSHSHSGYSDPGCEKKEEEESAGLLLAAPETELIAY